MQNTANKIKMILGSALMVLAFGLISMATPSQADAYYGYGGQGNYPCAHPFTYANGYYYCPNQATSVQPVYQYPTYQQPIYQYPQLTASCYASNTSGSVPAGTSVQWTAYASGGAGSYTYSWSGTDGVYGSGSTAYMTYYNEGYKTASVTVYSGGQSISVACSGSINVYGYNNYYQPTYVQPVYQQPVYQQPTIIQSNSNGLDIGCYADPANALVNQPVTWNVEVTGGMAPYSYSWSGSDGLSGSSNTVIKYYDSTGAKSALVTVTSADGRTGTRACTNSIAVSRPGGSTVARATTPAPAAQSNNGLGASAFFSLNNVPWGWVAVLVILVLFATVMYLLFNKTKI